MSSFVLYSWCDTLFTYFSHFKALKRDRVTQELYIFSIELYHRKLFYPTPTQNKHITVVISQKVTEK
jgi:hypothetical protein